MVQMNLFTKEKQTHKENTGEKRGGINWEFRITSYKIDENIYKIDEE